MQEYAVYSKTARILMHSHQLLSKVTFDLALLHLKGSPDRHKKLLPSHDTALTNSPNWPPDGSLKGDPGQGALDQMKGPLCFYSL